MVIVSYAGPRGPCRKRWTRGTCSEINDDNDDQKWTFPWPEQRTFSPLSFTNFLRAELFSYQHT